MTGNLNMGTKDITNVGLVDGVDVSAIGGTSHTQNTDNILKQSAGGADLINNATLKSNLAVDAGITVDGVDVSAHQARHDWLGADELRIKSLAMSMPVFQTLEPDTSMTSTFGGTGYDWSGKFYIYVATGATSGSSMGRVFNSFLWHDYTTPTYRHIWAGRLYCDSSNDKSELWYGMFSDTITFPTVTSNHYAFRVISTVDGTNAALYASNGAGVAETSTQLIASLAGWTSVYVLAIYGAADIKYYYSTDEAVTWNLGATHTTNRPVAGQYYGAWVKNSEAVDKAFNIWGVKYGSP
jgi:hypothetical protein